MKLVPVECRTHKGIFRVVKKPGRRPVKCNVKNPCTKASGQESTQDKPVLPPGRRDLRMRTVTPGKVTVSRVEQVASHIKNNRIAERRLAEKAGVVENVSAVGRRIKARATQQEPSTESVQKPPENATLFLAMKAKEQLAANGWEVLGEAWLDDGHDYAALNATRGEELITALWRDGEAISQEYSLWDNGNMAKNVPAKQPEPNTKLGFDPDELSDVELLRAINGQRVKWVNRISGGEESAVIDAKMVQIQHTYIGGTADENPGDRIVKFVDKGRGYRAFYVKQLCAVESP